MEDTFPAFFEQHSHLPRGVGNPAALSEWEEHHRELLPGPHPAREEQTEAGAPAVNRGDLIEGYLNQDRPIASEGEGARDYDQTRLADLGLRPVNLILEESPWAEAGMADAVAAYLPWHFFGPGWGIDFYGGPFHQLVVDVHHAVNTPDSPYRSLDLVTEAVMRAVLAHELFHFRSEIAGTILEAVEQRSLVRERQMFRYELPNAWTVGPLEELLASYFEQEANWELDHRVSADYERILALAGPGYRDFAAAMDDCQRALMLLQLASDIAGRPLHHFDWPELDEEAIACVPVRWWGPTVFASGFVLPREPPMLVAKFEAYLRHYKIPIEPGGKHKHFRVGAQTCPYPTSKGKGKKELPHDVLSSISNTLGFPNPAALRAAVRQRTPPPAVAFADR